MENQIIKIEKVEYTYKSHYEDALEVKALKGININIEKGQFIVVIGRNGSGKSTFARLLNVLLLPTKGTVYINGYNTKDKVHQWEIRRSAGMIFQNPDNQIIGTIVEEDVAFGPENIGVPPDEIRKLVDEALITTGISEYSKHAPHLLSGGQKQRVAIAGILAMRPECIILDEATAMLDPIGRKEVMGVLKKLNKEDKITIVHITHHMEEAVNADRVIVIDDGKIILEGEPREVFSNVRKVKDVGLDVPEVTELFHELNNEGFNLPIGVLDVEGAFDVLEKLVKDSAI